MFMRFVQLSINPDAATAFERFYEHRVGPALLAVDGCIFARLIKATDSESSFSSFTLWESAEQAFEYENSGQYADLISENEPFEMDSTEWKIQLTADNVLEYKPVKEKPVVKAMPIVAGSSEDDAASQIGDHTYVRVLNAKINPGHFDELSREYDKLTPELLSTPGCRAGYLIAMKDNSECISVTIWDSQELASEYESSGKFAKLLAKVTPHFSSFYQWKMTLDPSRRSRTHLSDDLSIQGYTMVSAESAVES